MKKTLLPALCLALVLGSCKLNNKESLFEVEAIDPSFNEIVNSSAEGKIICSGLTWTEGPLWIEKQKMLLFSDIPNNMVYKWTEAGGKEVYLQPSGYTSDVKRGGETGSNGLTLDENGALILCQHGDRRIARMNSDITKPSPNFTSLADNYLGKKFNSPNDVFVRANGDIFFTDPPYGLEKNVDDPLKEMPFQGVYKLSKNGQLKLLTDTITRPNGIALMPDGKTLIIANSDSAKAIWYAYELDANDSLTNPRIVYDASSYTKDLRGLPDGLKIDKAGHIFATGPGGLWVFDKTFKLIGKIKFKELTSNCSFADDERTLYITNDDDVVRLKLR